MSLVLLGAVYFTFTISVVLSCHGLYLISLLYNIIILLDKKGRGKLKWNSTQYQVNSIEIHNRNMDGYV